MLVATVVTDVMQHPLCCVPRMVSRLIHQVPTPIALILLPSSFLLCLGNVYIADTYNQRIRKVTASTGIITTIAGTGSGGYSGDNGPASSATLNYPHGVSTDSSGNVYVADTYNQRVRKVTASTDIITTIAGTGSTTFSGDGGVATSATLYNPHGTSPDSVGTNAH